MSPDLNPIEHQWKLLKITVQRRNQSNLRQLEQFAQEDYDKLPVEKYRSLDLIAVIASREYATKY